MRKYLLPPAKRPPTARPSRGGCWIGCALLLILLLGLLLVSAWGYRKLARARDWFSLIKTDLDALQALVPDGAPSGEIDYEGLKERLRSTRSHLKSVQAEFELPLALAPHLCWLPLYGADLHAAPILLQMALDLTLAGDEVLTALDPLFATLNQGPEPGEGVMEVAVTTLQEAQPLLSAAQATLERVRQDRQQICGARLSPRFSEWLGRLEKMLPLLEDGLRGAMALPELLGASGPKTYLILAQNEDELRPTGGFISGVARLVLEQGEIAELSFEDSYAVDDLSYPYPEPPRPLREIMGAGIWVFRDSNWSPDFPTSARIAQGLYQIKYDVEIHGILALDQHALQAFMGALGPLVVEGYPEPVTQGNVIRAIRESWAPAEEEGITAEWWLHRKDLMASLLVAAVDKLQNEPGQISPVDLVWAAFQALEEKHLFIHLSADGEVSQMLRQTGWDGALRDVTGDYLTVVDANLGFNKVNPHIQQSLSYTVDLTDPARPQATLTLVHRHSGTNTGAPCQHGRDYDLTYEQMMQRCYWDYVRVYVPRGSHPLEATPHPVPEHLLLSGQARDGRAELIPDEAGKTVFATFLVLAPGEHAETRFVYDLPPEIVRCEEQRCRYRLYVQKQGGTVANELQITLRLPPGAEDVAVAPAPTAREGDALRIERLLDSDLDLTYLFSIPDTGE